MQNKKVDGHILQTQDIYVIYTLSSCNRIQLLWSESLCCGKVVTGLVGSKGESSSQHTRMSSDLRLLAALEKDEREWASAVLKAFALSFSGGKKGAPLSTSA